MESCKKAVAALIIPVFLLAACGTAHKEIVTPTPELDPMPEAPPENVAADKRWVIAVEKPEDAIKKGILMSAEKAAWLAKYKIKYDDLRTWTELERELWSGKWAIERKNLMLADQKIEDMQPGWWDRNKFEVGMATGIILGALAAIGIMYGVIKTEAEAQ